jgi:hypothetical protein
MRVRSPSSATAWRTRRTFAATSSSASRSASASRWRSESAGYHHWVLVTNDHTTDAATLESEHRHKAKVESGVRELKENFGLDVWRKHGFMANWAWLLVVTTALNLTRWSQLLGQLDAEGDLRAKKLRYRYLNVPAMLVRSGRLLVLKLQHDYPLLDVFVAALARLRSLPVPAG